MKTLVLESNSSTLELELVFKAVWPVLILQSNFSSKQQHRLVVKLSALELDC